MAPPPSSPPQQANPALEAEHEAAVQRISKQLAAFHAAGTPYRIYHGRSTNTTRPSSHARNAIIDTSALTNILSLDVAARTARVQPNLSVAALAAATLPHGLFAPATPEFPAITVGGAFAGTAGESSSFKHGFFDRCVRAVRLALPDGRVVRAEQRGENADLYAAAVGTLGTLGVAVELELALAPAAPFVRTRYVRVAGADDALATLAREIRSPGNDFVDAILYGESEGVVVLGTFAQPDATTPVRRFDRARDQWFYLHARTQAQAHASHAHSNLDKKPSPPQDLIPTASYLFRYDRSAFWMGAHAFPLFHTPFTRATRAALDPLLRTARLYAALHHSGYAARFILQDLVLPFDAAAPFLACLRAALAVFPLWLCPIAAAGSVALAHQPRTHGALDFFCNVGVWGPPAHRPYGPRDGDRWHADNVALEDACARAGGRKWLYAQVFAASADAFWEGQGLDREAYEGVRARWGAAASPDVWDKVRDAGGRERRVSKARGLAMLLLGRDAVLRR